MVWLPVESFRPAASGSIPAVAYGAAAYIEYRRSQEAAVLLERSGLKIEATGEHRLAIAVGSSRNLRLGAL